MVIRAAYGLSAATGSGCPGRYVEPAAPSVRSPAWQAWSPLPLRWVYGEHTCPPAPAPARETREHSARSASPPGSGKTRVTPLAVLGGHFTSSAGRDHDGPG